MQFSNFARTRNILAEISKKVCKSVNVFCSTAKLKLRSNQFFFAKIFNVFVHQHKKICAFFTKHWWKTTKVVLAKRGKSVDFKSPKSSNLQLKRSKLLTKLQNSFWKSAKNIFCVTFSFSAKMFLCQCTKRLRTFPEN